MGPEIARHIITMLKINLLPVKLILENAKPEREQINTSKTLAQTALMIEFTKYL